MVTKKEISDLFEVVHRLSGIEKSLEKARKLLKPQTYGKIKAQLRQAHARLLKLEAA